MQWFSKRRLAQALSALLVGLAAASPALAAPPAQTNLLVNGGLDNFTGGLATGWEPWWEETPNPGTGSLDYAFKPNWAPETNPTFVQSGSASQHIGRNWDPWRGGIRQTFAVAAGSVVRITASARAFASTPDWPSPSESAVQSRMQVGADPNGSIEWYSANVKWSGTANPHDTWQALTLDVTAGSSGKVTVFLGANFKGDSRYHLDVWWDSVSATVVGAASAPTNPPPAATQPAGQPQPTAPGAATNPPPAATAFGLPTPGADGTIVYIVQDGDTLWRIAAISGLTVQQLQAMNGLTTNFISVGQRLIIGYAEGAGQATPEPTQAPGTEGTPAGGEVSAGTPAVTTDAAPTQAPEAATQVAQVSPTPLGTGTVCALLWNDANGNGVRDASETLIANARLMVVDAGTGAPLQNYTTDGRSEPHCFEDLAAGSYTISAVTPGGYNPTTPDSRALNVDAGSTSMLEFGAQPGAAAAEATPARNNPLQNAGLRTALLGAAGVVFLLLAAGVAALVFVPGLRRR